MRRNDEGRPVVRTAKDVTDLINSGRAQGGHATAITMIALGGIFVDAYDFSSITFGLPDTTSEFGLGSWAAGVVAASIMVGALVGALVGGYLIDRLGRYKPFMADMPFFVVAAIGCALAPNAELLTVGRFLLGIGIGMDFPVALAFIAAFTALRGKGSRVTLWQPMWCVATAASFLVLLPLYFILPADLHGQLWRFGVGFGAVPALVVMLVRHRYMDESPAWAANQGDLERAAGILRRFYGVDVVVERPATAAGVTALVTAVLRSGLRAARYSRRFSAHRSTDLDRRAVGVQYRVRRDRWVRSTPTVSARRG